MQTHKPTVYSLTFALILLVTASVALGQVENSATPAYQDWKAKNILKTKGQMAEHTAIAFAASKIGNMGAVVEMTVGVGPNVTELPPLEFRLEPLTIKTSDEGKMVLEAVDSPSSLKQGRLTGWDKASEIVATPSMTIRVPSGTSAVRIGVRGFGQSDREFSILLPLKDFVTTGVLGKTLKCTSENLLDCTWYTGQCSGGCSAMLCAACDNASPSLNCVSCSMGCGPGSPGSNCTPSMEAPEGCNISSPRP